ncbi:uncharacterized protein LOC142635417 [Castanea sativa]|uniref:uncharacterized protein LOC142635417 n=1 Tax=Castanea sativa TaxID=21020 RepID=UPI003F64F50B
MDDARRRAIIKQQAAKKKKGGDASKMDLSQTAPKRPSFERWDRHSKKQILVTGLPAGQGSGMVKPPPKLGIGKGKGLMTNPDPVKEKPPVLLREDPQYALCRIGSIIADNDYEDLRNHATEAMGETCLFSLTQGVLMAKGLLDRCLAQERALERVRAKAKATAEELDDLKLWRVRHEQKLTLSEQARENLEKDVELLRKTVKAHDDNIYQAKVDAIREYRDSDAFLMELGSSFSDGFDDCIRQVKASFPDLDLAHINIDAEAQTLAHPVDSEGTEELFGEVPGDDGVAKAGEETNAADSHQGCPEGPEETVTIQD